MFRFYPFGAVKNLINELTAKFFITSFTIKIIQQINLFVNQKPRKPLPKKLFTNQLFTYYLKFQISRLSDMQSRDLYHFDNYIKNQNLQNLIIVDVIFSGFNKNGKLTPLEKAYQFVRKSIIGMSVCFTTGVIYG